MKGYIKLRKEDTEYWIYLAVATDSFPDIIYYIPYLYKLFSQDDSESEHELSELIAQIQNDILLRFDREQSPFDVNDMLDTHYHVTCMPDGTPIYKAAIPDLEDIPPDPERWKLCLEIAEWELNTGLDFGQHHQQFHTYYKQKMHLLTSHTDVKIKAPYVSPHIDEPEVMPDPEPCEEVYIEEEPNDVQMNQICQEDTLSHLEQQDDSSVFICLERTTEEYVATVELNESRDSPRERNPNFASYSKSRKKTLVHASPKHRLMNRARHIYALSLIHI